MPTHKLPINFAEKVILDTIEAILKEPDVIMRHQKTNDFIAHRTEELEQKTKIVEITYLTSTFYKGFIHPETRIFTNVSLDPFLVNDDSIYRLLVENLHHFINHENWKNHAIGEILPAALMLTLDHYFGNNWLEDTEPAREKFYIQHTDTKNNPIDMEEIKTQRIAACLEKSAASQNLLSFLGYGSTLFFSTQCQLSGTELEPHAYNIVHTHLGKYLLFDPANPVIIFDSKDNLYSILPAFYPIDTNDIHALQKGGRIEVRHQNYYQHENGYLQKELKYRTYSG